MPGKAVDNHDPATGKLIGSYPLNSAVEVADLIAKSRAVQGEWAALPYRERSAALARVGKAIASRAEELAAIISANSGKTLTDALTTEMVPAILALRFYRSHGKRLLATRRIHGGSILMFNKRSRLQRVPFGLVGIISPWNYPFAIPFAEVVMALLAGNGVLLKVATDSLAVGRALADCIAQAGLPKGLFAYVNLPGREAGDAFIQGGVDKLFFTGSTEVGKLLIAESGARLIPMVLELGGNDAAIVRADADLERAAAGIVWAGFSNTGQACGGAQRILVDQGIHDDFVARLKARVESLRVGLGSDLDMDMGCLSSARQKAQVEAQVARCLAQGATVIARSSLDGELAKGNFMGAIVLGDVKPDSPVMREEIFGPVMAVIPFKDDDEAVRIANDSVMGLSASVWSRNHAAARALATRLRVGAVMINDHLMSHGLAETPWGGFGESGIGRSHAATGFLEMTQVRVVIDDLMPGAKKDLWWHPHSAKVYKGMLAILRLVAGPGLGTRLGAALNVVRFFFRYWNRD